MGSHGALRDPEADTSPGEPHGTTPTNGSVIGRLRSSRWLDNLGPGSLLTLGTLMVILTLVIVIPIAFILYGATRSDSVGMPDAEFTLEPILTVMSGAYLRSFVGTILLGLSVAAASVGIGLVFAWILARTDIPWRGALELVVIGPLFLSPFVGAIAWVTLAAPNSGILNVAARNFLGIEQPIVNVMTNGGLIFVMSIYFIPYGYLFASAALKNMDPALEEAS